MKCFNHSCQGSSHKIEDKECQDFSYSEMNPEIGLAIAVVSDGHGGKTYFRSSVGSRLATEITVGMVKSFVSDISSANIKVFEDLPFTQVGVTDDFVCPHDLSERMKHLFSSIYSQWRHKITEHAIYTPISDREKERVKPEYLAFLNPQNDDFKEKLVKVYGCTLMCYVRTSKFWFAFHIGDGKFVALDDKYNFCQPIPWDEKCFQNITTSLCDPNPLSEFRFCAEGDGKFPFAVFLGSDGIDDTYSTDSSLYTFYGSIIKNIKKEGFENVANALRNDLPSISEHGSHDDMSVAFVYDEIQIDAAVAQINTFEYNLLKDIIEQHRKVIAAKTSELEGLNKEIEPVVSWISRLRSLIDELKQRLSKEEANLRSYEEQHRNLERQQAQKRMLEKEIEIEKESMTKCELKLDKLKSTQQSWYQRYFHSN